MSPSPPDRVVKDLAALIAQGRAPDAVKLAEQALATDPGEPRLWQALATAHMRLGDLSQATESLQRAVALAGENVALLIACGRQLAALGERRLTSEVAGRAAGLKPAGAPLNDALGTLLTLCEDPHRARHHFERAATLDPGNGGYEYNLATAQRMTGDLAGAEATLARIIARDPGNAAAHYLRSDLRRQTRDDAALEAMIRALELPSQTPADRVMLGYAIAKTLDDLGDYPAAFTHWSQASEAHRRSFQYEVAGDVATLNQLAATHHPGAFQGPRGQSRPGPLFVMGLPRTGTTLVERILDSHPEVQGAGELQAFPFAAIKAVRRAAGRAVSKQEFALAALRLDGEELARDYLRAAGGPPAGKRFFVDKQPLNYLYAGLIHHAMPDAKLILLRRDPMDACFAMYRTLFVGAYPFTYRLRELAAYYHAWRALTEHWEAALRPTWLTVDYEELVNDTERTVRRLLEHCGLPWDRRCLEFHDDPSGVTTASAVSVRRPIFTSSVGRWRRYQAELKPLIDALATRNP